MNYQYVIEPTAESQLNVQLLLVKYEGSETQVVPLHFTWGEFMKYLGCSFYSLDSYDFFINFWLTSDMFGVSVYIFTWARKTCFLSVVISLFNI